MSTVQIALDAMGGDDAPEATLRGALRAVAAGTPGRIAPERLLLVGDEPRMRSWLAEHGGNPGFALRHASQVIGMGESPAVALRAKKDSSIGGCVAAVKAGECGAIVAMGNTGAAVGAATMGLGTLEGVRRPGIAVTAELSGHPLTLLDMGANVAPQPRDLQQYGVMGSIYARDLCGVEAPRVALLNVGEEEGKGTELHKEAWELLAAAGRAGQIAWIGNVEGGDLFRNRADVIVCDGFTGNVVLKLIEDFGAFMMELVLQELKLHEASWSREALASLSGKVDYSQYGGALLLGVRGVVVIGHGRSDEVAVANAILRSAARALDAGVNRHIVEGLESAARPSAAGG
jgi:glycerol-3-phosphate acyltransferase PlsX